MQKVYMEVKNYVHSKTYSLHKNVHKVLWCQILNVRFIRVYLTNPIGTFEVTHTHTHTLTHTQTQRERDMFIDTKRERVRERTRERERGLHTYLNDHTKSYE